MNAGNLTGLIIVVAVLVLAVVVAGTMNSTPARQGGLAGARTSPEQEALIAKHELEPGMTREAVIEAIGTNYIRWGQSGRTVESVNWGPGGWAWIESRMTPNMVIASWGSPDSTREGGIGLEYTYHQPPDGDISAQFNYENVCIIVTTTLAPAYFKRHFPAWTDEQCGLVAAGLVYIGMTEEMALMARGRPSDINRSVGSWGVNEQWVYRSSDTYLYFDNGILTSWQD